MKKFIIALPMIAALAACETKDGTLATGALAGAILGATVSSGSDRLKGAALGGAAGLATGAVINNQKTGKCVYERNDGTRYTAACP